MGTGPFCKQQTSKGFSIIYNVQPMLEHSTKNLVKYLDYKYRKVRTKHWKPQQLRFARVTFNISYEK